VVSTVLTCVTAVLLSLLLLLSWLLLLLLLLSLHCLQYGRPGEQQVRDLSTQCSAASSVGAAAREQHWLAGSLTPRYCLRVCLAAGVCAGPSAWSCARCCTCGRHSTQQQRQSLQLAQ